MRVEPVTPPSPTPRSRTSPQRLLSGYAAGGFGLLVVGLGGWWFTVALGVMVHLGLLEYFRLAQSKGIRPATKTTLVLVQLLLLTTQWAHGGNAAGLDFAADLAGAVLPLSGAVICGWLLLQPLTGSIADVASSIFALFYLGFLPSYWIRLRDLSDPSLAPSLAGWGDAWPPVSSGMVLMLMACLLIVATDIGSYVIGRRWGRHPLSPISPGKTVEGALGGMVCALLLGAGFGLLLGWNFGWVGELCWAWLWRCAPWWVISPNRCSSGMRASRIRAISCPAMAASSIASTATCSPRRCSSRSSSSCCP